MFTMKDVRKGFSKSLIALSDGKVSVRYFSTPENRWATQSFDNDNGNSKAVFETLLSNSDELGITISPESGVVFDFMVNEKSDSPEVYLYYPTSHNLTEREYEEFLKSRGGYSQAYEQFAKRFDGVDMEDDEAVLEVISELISERREDDGIIDFEGISRWGNLYPMTRDFAEEFGFGLLDANPPDSDCEGFVTLSRNNLFLLMEILDKFGCI